MLAFLRGVRASQRALRLRLWRYSTAARLRARRCPCRIVVGRHLKFDTLPVLKVTDGGQPGSLEIRIGNDVQLGSSLILDVNTGRESVLTIGDGTLFEHAVRVQLGGGSLSIGDHCEIRDNTLLKVSSPDAALSLGDQVKVGRGVAVHCHESVSLEDRVTLAERVTVVDSFHDVDGSDVWTMLQPIGVAPVRIESNTMVLSGAVVVHGTTIGRNATVCANALVGSGTYPPGVVLLGNPARAVRQLNPESTQQ